MGLAFAWPSLQTELVHAVFQTDSQFMWEFNQSLWLGPGRVVQKYCQAQDVDAKGWKLELGWGESPCAPSSVLATLEHVHMQVRTHAMQCGQLYCIIIQTPML